MKIYTRTGDAGQTGLFGGQRVAKDDIRVDTYGAVDELNSVMGIARAEAPEGELALLITRLQNQLFTLGGDLATPHDAGETHGKSTIARISHEDVQALEAEIDRLTDSTPPLRCFILPGGTKLGAWLHLARSVCRRAERLCVSLSREQEINPQALRYLNRLSDLLFTMARAANHAGGVADIPWSSQGGVT